MKFVFALLVALGFSAPFTTAALAGPDDCTESQIWDEESGGCVDAPQD